jgi:hypothetical protein
VGINMDIDKFKTLKKGMEFKNYKELCEFLGEPIKTGEGKEKQVQEWSKYFAWKNIKFNFIITKVFEKPKAISTIDHLELLLIHQMATSSNTNYIIFSPKTTMFKSLGLINPNYGYCKRNPDYLASYLKIEPSLVYEFFNSVDKMITNQFKKVLKNLTDTKIIQYFEVMRCCSNVWDDTNINPNYEYDLDLDEDNEFDYPILRKGKRYSYRNATDEEIYEKLRIEKNVLQEMGRKSLTDVIKHGQFSEYHKEVTERFKDQLNINFFYTSYKIIFHPYCLSTAIKLILSKKDFINYVTKANKDLQNKILENAKTRQEKAKENYTRLKIDEYKQYGIEVLEYENLFSENFKTNLINRTDDDYLEKMEEIMEKLINLAYPNIIDDIKTYMENIEL